MLVIQSGIWRIVATDSQEEGYRFEADSGPPFGWIHADDWVRKRPARHLVRKMRKLREAVANSAYHGILPFAERQGIHLGYDFMCAAYPMGHKCGYVRIPASHPWYHARNHDAVSNVDVHGGITFNRLDVDTRIRSSYENSRWIGFDCNHWGDAPDPEVAAKYGKSVSIDDRTYGVVRSLEYVTQNCALVCEQVAQGE